MMTAPVVIGVFGISGVGKSWLVSEVAARIPGCLHLQGSALIKQGLADPSVSSEELRCSGSNRIVANQRILVAMFDRALSEHTGGLVLFDGHLLVDSSTTPGLITDAIIVKTSWLKDHQKEAAAIVKSWNEAVAYYRSNPDESIAIMAKGVGGWLKDPKDFKETLPGIKFYGAEDNKTFFGTKDKPGPLYQTVKDAIAVWSSKGKLQVKATPEDLIDYSFVNGG